MRVLRNFRWLIQAAGIAGLAVMAAGCSSTIHEQATIGGVETLSVDAKQRLVLVADSPYRSGKVTCTEPMPDALVARAAVAAAGGNFAAPAGPGGAGTTNISGSGSMGSSESAASIGFRNETIQMLRDGYYRLCEAHMNGALSPQQYEIMISNTDTFMVVVSALQTLGSNPVTPSVAINAGGVSASVPKDAPATATVTGPNGEVTKFQTVSGTNSARDPKGAETAAQIVRDYLNYRANLIRYYDTLEARKAAAKRSGKRPVSYQG